MMDGEYETHIDCVNFLHREAEILDEGRLEEWFELLSEDIEYKAPIRERKDTRAEEFSEDSYYFIEDIGTIRTRIDKNAHEYSVSTNPPEHECRMVTNVRVVDQNEHEVNVVSRVLYRVVTVDQDRSDRILTCSRDDILRRDGDSFKLAERVVYFDQSSLTGGFTGFI